MDEISSGQINLIYDVESGIERALKRATENAYKCGQSEYLLIMNKLIEAKKLIEEASEMK